jgi:hypothetical protein
MQKGSKHVSQVFTGFGGLCVMSDLSCQCLGILCVNYFQHSDIQHIPVRNSTVCQEYAAQYKDLALVPPSRMKLSRYLNISMASTKIRWQ